MLTANFECRMDIQELDRLRHVCKLRGESISNFVRLAVRKELTLLGYGTAAEQAAFGVSGQGDLGRGGRSG